jgi:hypothetical protein
VRRVSHEQVVPRDARCGGKRSHHQQVTRVVVGQRRVTVRRRREHALAPEVARRRRPEPARAQRIRDRRERPVVVLEREFHVLIADPRGPGRDAEAHPVGRQAVAPDERQTNA